MYVGVESKKRSLLKVLGVCSEILLEDTPCIEGMEDLLSMYNKMRSIVDDFDDVTVSALVIATDTLTFTCTTNVGTAEVTTSVKSEELVVSGIEELIADVFEEMQGTYLHVQDLNDFSCILDWTKYDKDKVAQLLKEKDVTVPQLAVKYFTQENLLNLRDCYEEYAKTTAPYPTFDWLCMVDAISTLLSSILPKNNDGLTAFEVTLLSIDRGIVAGLSALKKYGLIGTYERSELITVWTGHESLHETVLGNLKLLYNPFYEQFDLPTGGLQYQSEEDSVALAIHFKDYFYASDLKTAVMNYAIKLED